MKASELALLDPNAEVLAVRTNGQVKVLSPVVAQVATESDYCVVTETGNHTTAVFDLGDIESIPGWNKWA